MDKMNMIPTMEGMVDIDDVRKGKIKLFPMYEEEWNKYQEWYKTLDKINYGAAGGGIEFVFEPTGLGMIMSVRYNGNVIDLTNTSNW